MKLKPTFLTVLTGCFVLSFASCTKVSNAIFPAPITNKFLKGADGPPLYFVDTVEMGYLNDDNKGKLKMSPNRIESITVLSPASTDDLVSRFGQKGKNGVILVTTKK